MPHPARQISNALRISCAADLESAEAHLPIDLDFSLQGRAELFLVVSELVAYVHLEGDCAVVQGFRKCHICIPLNFMLAEKLAGERVFLGAFIYFSARILIWNLRNLRQSGEKSVSGELIFILDSINMRLIIITRQAWCIISRHSPWAVHAIVVIILTLHEWIAFIEPVLLIICRWELAAKNGDIG